MPDARDLIPAAPAGEPWSLTQRVTRNMLVVLGGLWLVGSIVLVLGMFYESTEVLDSALRETAERFLFLPDVVVDDPAEQRRFLTEIGAHEEYVVYQVYDARGQMRLRSHGAPEVPLIAGSEEGIHNTDGWRVLTLTRADGQRRVEVAEAETYREDVLRGSLGWLAGTMVCLMGGASLALTVIMRRGRRAVDAARLELISRAPDDLRPLSGTGAPLELQPWIAGVNSLMARDRVLIEAERAFAARTAHELRTPLAAARAQAQRLVEATPGGAARQNSLALVRQLDRLTRLATRLLQLARIESQASVRREPVDLATVAQMVVADFADAVASERLRIEVLDGNTGVIGDLDAIGIALRNLIDNALKHGGEDAWVTVLVETLSMHGHQRRAGRARRTRWSSWCAPSSAASPRPKARGWACRSPPPSSSRRVAPSTCISPIAGGRGFAAVLRFE